jgi:hypothetical protein
MIVRVVVVLIASLLLGGCDPTEETSNKPWAGYAWNKGKSRFEWWFNAYESQRDCLEHMKSSVVIAPNSEWYSEPVGCGYNSNSYWRVWWFNLIYPDKHIACIWRSPEATSVKAGYGPLLEGNPRRGTNGYCV